MDTTGILPIKPPIIRTIQTIQNCFLKYTLKLYSKSYMTTVTKALKILDATNLIDFYRLVSIRVLHKNTLCKILLNKMMYNSYTTSLISMKHAYVEIAIKLNDTLERVIYYPDLVKKILIDKFYDDETQELIEFYRTLLNNFTITNIQILKDMCKISFWFFYFCKNLIFFI